MRPRLGWQEFLFILLVVLVGIPIVGFGIELARYVARSERWRMELVDGRPMVPHRYRPLDFQPSAPYGDWLRQYAEGQFLDFARWRDVVYTLIGFPLVILEFALMVGIWAIVLGLFAATAALFTGVALEGGTFEGETIPLVAPIVTGVMCLALIPVAAFITRGLMTVQRSIAQTLLCVDPTEALRQDVERLRESRSAAVELEASEDSLDVAMETSENSLDIELEASEDGLDIDKDVCWNCPTYCMEWDGNELKIEDANCVKCMHCINVMPKALKPGDERGATILIGGKAPIIGGALLCSVFVPFLEMDPEDDYEDLKELTEAIWDLWGEHGKLRERVGEFIQRVGLGNFLEAIGLEPEPEMVAHPRENPYVFYEEDEDEDDEDE